ncbi:MAG: response regulator [Methanospirillum sp.]|nr:response regulator [Methanospirillum sp.]
MVSVLLVDDEQAILDIARAFLERHGEFSVVTALSASEGLQLLKEQEFDAVISDYEMPVMNGLNFLKTIREEKNHIPFIIFTGRGREDVVIEALNAGADYYIQKGGDPRAQFTELAYKIRESVRKKKELHPAGEQEHARVKLIRYTHALAELLVGLEKTPCSAEQASIIRDCHTRINEMIALFGETGKKKADTDLT